VPTIQARSRFENQYKPQGFFAAKGQQLTAFLLIIRNKVWRCCGVCQSFQSRTFADDQQNIPRMNADNIIDLIPGRS
jgi:hypothetical protein